MASSKGFGEFRGAVHGTAGLIILALLDAGHIGTMRGSVKLLDMRGSLLMVEIADSMGVSNGAVVPHLQGLRSSARPLGARRQVLAFYGNPHTGANGGAAESIRGTASVRVSESN